MLLFICFNDMNIFFDVDKILIIYWFYVLVGISCFFFWKNLEFFIELEFNLLLFSY